MCVKTSKGLRILINFSFFKIYQHCGQLRVESGYNIIYKLKRHSKIRLRDPKADIAELANEEQD